MEGKGRQGLLKGPKRERQGLSHPSLHGRTSQFRILAFRGNLSRSAF